MDRRVPTIPPNMTVLTLSELITKGDLMVGRRHGALIVNPDQSLAGIITRSDVIRALRRDPSGSTTVLAAGQTRLTVAFPDEPLYDAIARMLKHDIGRLPVVGRNDPGKVIGYLGRADILASRMRHHEEEESRSHGPLLTRLKFKPANQSL